MNNDNSQIYDSTIILGENIYNIRSIYNGQKTINEVLEELFLNKITVKLDEKLKFG